MYRTKKIILFFWMRPNKPILVLGHNQKSTEI